MRHIKNYKKMTKEGLLIAYLKSKQSHAELYKSKSNSAEIEETENFFNEIRNKFSKSKTKEIRKRIYGNEEKKVKKYQEEQKKKQHAKELKKIFRKITRKIKKVS